MSPIPYEPLPDDASLQERSKRVFELLERARGLPAGSSEDIYRAALAETLKIENLYRGSVLFEVVSQLPLELLSEAIAPSRELSVPYYRVNIVRKLLERLPEEELSRLNVYKIAFEEMHRNQDEKLRSWMRDALRQHAPDQSLWSLLERISNEPEESLRQFLDVLAEEPDEYTRLRGYDWLAGRVDAPQREALYDKLLDLVVNLGDEKRSILFRQVAPRLSLRQIGRALEIIAAIKSSSSRMSSLADFLDRVVERLDEKLLDAALRILDRSGKAQAIRRYVVLESLIKRAPAGHLRRLLEVVAREPDLFKRAAGYSLIAQRLDANERAELYERSLAIVPELPDDQKRSILLNAAPGLSSRQVLEALKMIVSMSGKRDRLGLLESFVHATTAALATERSDEILAIARERIGARDREFRAYFFVLLFEHLTAAHQTAVLSEVLSVADELDPGPGASLLIALSKRESDERREVILRRALEKLRRGQWADQDDLLEQIPSEYLTPDERRKVLSRRLRGSIVFHAPLLPGDGTTDAPPPPPPPRPEK